MLSLIYTTVKHFACSNLKLMTRVVFVLVACTSLTRSQYKFCPCHIFMDSWRKNWKVLQFQFNSRTALEMFLNIAWGSFPDFEIAQMFRNRKDVQELFFNVTERCLKIIVNNSRSFVPFEHSKEPFLNCSWAVLDLKFRNC